MIGFGNFLEIYIFLRIVNITFDVPAVPTKKMLNFSLKIMPIMMAFVIFFENSYFLFVLNKTFYLYVFRHL